MYLPVCLQKQIQLQLGMQQVVLQGQTEPELKKPVILVLHLLAALLWQVALHLLSQISLSKLGRIMLNFFFSDYLKPFGKNCCVLTSLH